MARISVKKKDRARTLNCNSACWCRRRARPSSLGAPYSGTAHQSRHSSLGNPFCRLFRRLVCSDGSFLVVEVPEVRASVHRRVRCCCLPAKEVFLLRPSHRKRSRLSWTVTDRKVRGSADWRKISITLRMPTAHKLNAVWVRQYFSKASLSTVPRSGRPHLPLRLL